MATYSSCLQLPRLGMRLIIRSSKDLNPEVASLRQVLKRLDPEIPLFSVTDMDAIVSKAVERQRFNMLMFGVFAATALFLATVGTYGVISYSVTQRTREIGIRIALGAIPSEVIRILI